ncbi:hypothetical protein IGI04_014831 [Brassica rapa subsp. trilocularis]|uniref:Uncharacterized protein n=1 Tax=Brassica rapa subsp. trilocularis TaxID=1813537 RepID=A0ABQ7MNB1_BRACM|nr:hypothetical protein IGI04_014831 [Brassica rapa subsp. trilocularis]
MRFKVRKIDLGLILLPIHSHSTTEMHYIPIFFTNQPLNKTRPLCISIANPLKLPKETSKQRPQATSDWSTPTDGGNGEAAGERSGGSGGEAELRESFQSRGSGGERGKWRVISSITTSLNNWGYRRFQEGIGDCSMRSSGRQIWLPGKYVEFLVFFDRLTCSFFEFWICLVLTLLGYLHGILYALYVLTK